MTSRPWMKFYPRDWRGDQALRAVSMAARGFWMECLCLMHEAEPRGHLLLNGKKVEVDALARMVGSSPDEVSAWMAELQSAGVFTLARNGVVTSRRMIRDEKAAKEGAKSVAKRWQQTPEKKGENRDPNRSPHRPPSPPPITQRPEARDIRPFPVQQQRGEVERASGCEPGAAAVVPTSEALGDLLRRAAGYETDPSPDLFNVSPIWTLIRDGFDLHRDILPVIRARALKLKRPARTWLYFVDAIREAHSSRPVEDIGGSMEDELAEARRRLAQKTPPRGDD